MPSWKSARTPHLLAAAMLCLSCWSGAALAAVAPRPTLLQRLFARVDDLVATRCLTPASGEALQGAVAAGALQAALGEGFELSKGGIQPHHIDIEIRDGDGNAHVVRVAIRGSESAAADGAGGVFDFYLRDSAADPRARQALLAIAAAVDAAIPETTLERCAGAGAPHAERRYPRLLALSAAVLQVLVVTAALIFALRVLGDSAARRQR
jgi:hypothetical protein